MSHRSVDATRSAFVTCAEAFEAEFDYLYRTVRRHGVPVQDAEDTVQRVFLTLWQRWSEYDQTRPLRPWLAGIAVRLAYHARARREIPVGVPVAVDGALDPEQQLSERRARALVMSALAELPDWYRASIVMRELDGLSVTEIAGLYGVSVQTASARLQAARKALARTVRRLSRRGAGRALAGLPSLEALLATERAVPPAPALVRRRAIARARAASPDQLPAGPAADGRLAWDPAGPLPLVRVAVALVLVTAVTLLAVVPARLPGRAEHSSEARKNATAGVTAPAALKPPELASEPPPAGASAVAGAGGPLTQVSESLALGDEITVTAWIRPRSLWGAQTIVARQMHGSRADDLFFGLIHDQLVVKSRTFRKRLDRPLPPPLGRWIHVAFTRSRQGAITLFADGFSLGQNRGRVLPSAPNPSPFTIGASISNADRSRADERFAGEMDDVRVYGRALSSAEVAELASSPGSAHSSR